jgi:hypothetical protein
MRLRASALITRFFAAFLAALAGLPTLRGVVSSVSLKLAQCRYGSVNGGFLLF